MELFHEAGVNRWAGGEVWEAWGQQGQHHLEAADGHQEGGGGVLFESPFLFLLHEWGERTNSARVATTGQIQILIGYGTIQCKGETAASEVRCNPLAIKVYP